MSTSFDGTTALVTGGGSGIGAAIATALAEAGAKVAVCDIAEDNARAVAERIGGLAITTDVSSPGSVAAAVAQAGTRLGTVSVLVNSAGVVGGGGPLLELPIESFRAAVDVNLLGVFLMTQAVGKALVAAGGPGSIVNISSAGALQPTVGLGHYEATKAAINALTRSAALELAPNRIRVNAIAPGPVDTPFTRFSEAPPEARQFWESRIPLGRIATPADLVPLALFLASPDAGHITGTVIPVEGGQLLG